jgi:hypothetical protein
MLGSTLDPIIPERLRQRHTEGFRAAIARGSSRYGDDYLLGVPARHADGRMISIEFSVAVVTADDGSVAYVSAIMRDVTARRAREQGLRRRPDHRKPPHLLRRQGARPPRSRSPARRRDRHGRVIGTAA